jgi:hypothetical protein
VAMTEHAVVIAGGGPTGLMLAGEFDDRDVDARESLLDTYHAEHHPVAARVLIDAKYVGTWELPALGPVTAPTAVLIRPDGYVAWLGDSTQLGLVDALTIWFGSPNS